MSGVFISYRRDDSRGTAGRLYDDLKDRFGRSRVFRDLDAVDPGADYALAIDQFIASCDAVVVVIGTAWLDIRDDEGRRRLEDPADLVRQEIVAALASDKLVVPVLVEDARMPAAAKLPADLAPLARRNALPLSDARWEYDVGVLVARLDDVITQDSSTVPPAGSGPASSSPPRPPPGWANRPVPPQPAPRPRSSSVPVWAWGAGIAALVMVLVAVGVVVATRGGGSNGNAASAGTTGLTAAVSSAPATAATSAVPVTSAVVTAQPPPTALPGETALTLSRSTGPVGTSITVAGAGFDARETVDIRFHISMLATAVTDARGSFSGAVIKVPAGSFPSFPYSVVASGRRSRKSAIAQFTVT